MPEIIYECDKCGHLIKPGVNFCANCGVELDWGEDGDSRQCPKCSTKVNYDDSYCPKCGTVILGESASKKKRKEPIFNQLYVLLGHEKFTELFPVIVTDRGSEFTDPLGIEFNGNGERRTRVFYCDPQRSDQKGGCEVCHEMIRRVLPKKSSFDNLIQEDVSLLMSHINSYTRKKLNDQSANQLFSFFYGEDTLAKLGIKVIPANEIKPNLIFVKNFVDNSDGSIPPAPESRIKTRENHDSADVNFTTPESRKSRGSNTDSNYTDLSETETYPFPSGCVIQ